MEKGYYAQNPRVIRETYRIGSRLSQAELVKMGSSMVTRHCVGREVYRLERTTTKTPEEALLGGLRQRRGTLNAQHFDLLV